jgi:7-dehydrocholesterol reductase
VGPALLIVFCPIVAVLFWYTAVHLDGSFVLLANIFKKHGLFITAREIFAPIFFGSVTSWSMIGIFAAFELALLKLLPGKIVAGPETREGYIPTYKDNGPLAFFTTVITYLLCSYGLHLFPASIIFDHFGEIICSLSLASYLFCLFLYWKGRYYPSSRDRSITKNFIFDYYWGTELYPRVLGWDVKQFTNCRFGMMSWPIILISFCAAQGSLYGLSNSLLISTLLQFFYIGKFFFWERGYLRSLDIMHDRAGFYICWGCLVWVPSIYTSPALYLVHHPIDLPLLVAALIFIVGVLSIGANFLADKQRMAFRESGGELLIFGKKPQMTQVTYKTHSGEERKNILLASGFWGIARHFHYVPELAGAFLWSSPALFTHFFPYFYFSFLFCLLFDRALRDDKRCAEKYGKGWEEHCKKVPYKILPFIY